MNNDTNFSRAYTCLFWSLKDCPIPSDLDLVSVENNIRDALYDLGYDGIVETRCHGKHGEDVDVHELIIDIIDFATSFFPDKPANLVVISKKISEASEFFRVLRAFRLRGFNVLLVEPPDDSVSENMFETAESIIDCTKLLDGSNPICSK